MWNITAAGFSSVVAFKPAKDKDTTARLGLDPAGDYLLVRGRDRKQLEYLAEFTGTPVDSDTAADYKYRTIVTREQYKAYLASEVDKIDYDSHFKEVSMSHKVNKGFKRWSRALYAIWSELELVQDTPAYQTKVWPRLTWAYPQTGKHAASESAQTFASAFGWDELLEQPEVTRLELGGSADAYSFTSREGDDLDDPWLWDLDADPRFVDLTDDELMELAEYESWHYANDQIVRENEELAAVGCASDAVAGTVSESPSKQRRRNRRQRNANKKGK